MTTISSSAIGIGLRQPHYRALLDSGAAAIAPASFVELHSENFFAAGGASARLLKQVRAMLPVSLHGVGLGLGNAQGLDDAHLRRLAKLVNAVEPALVSEHICWGAMAGDNGPIAFNDLLPLPHTDAALNHLCGQIDQTQQALRRPILIENVSAYLRFANDQYDELSFAAEASRRTGCKVLLDINNLYVNAVNFGFDAAALLNQLPIDAVGEFHLAGHCRTDDFLIDDHGAPVSDAVWNLYRQALARFGPQPTLIEWDTNIPPLDVLLEQARRAEAIVGAQPMLKVA